VWRADPTSLEQDPEHRLLKPPEIEKNFLISPPGSPPVGWEQVREDPPNSTPLADDLIAALRKLEIQAQFSRSKVEGRPGVEILIDPEEEHGIAVYVEDCDRMDDNDMDVYRDDDEHGNGEGWAYGDSRYRTGGFPVGWRPVPASMPPMPIHI
jgi:calcipressin-2